MITLTHSALNSRVLLSEDNPAIVTIESQTVFSLLISQMQAQINNEPGDFNISKDYKPITISKEVDLIHSPFLLDFGQRKILLRICSDFDKLSMSSEHYEATAQMQQAVQLFLERMSSVYSVPLLWDIELTAGNLAKAVNIKVDIEELSIVGRLLTYMEIMTTLKIASIFVFVNLSTFLTSEQLKSLFHEVRLKKYCMLLFENRSMPRNTEFERHLIVDADLCEIINDFSGYYSAGLHQ